MLTQYYDIYAIYAYYVLRITYYLLCIPNIVAYAVCTYTYFQRPIWCTFRPSQLLCHRRSREVGSLGWSRVLTQSRL